MKPICTTCQQFYKPAQNGYIFVEGMPTENGAARGTLEPEKWKPYKLWSGDLWECRGCGHTIIVGVGQQPIAEHFQADFAEQLTTYRATLQINDC